MKHGRNPTLKQKKLISEQTSAGRQLNPEAWLVVKNTSSEMVIQHRAYGSTRVIKKVTSK